MTLLSRGWATEALDYVLLHIHYRYQSTPPSFKPQHNLHFKLRGPGTAVSMPQSPLSATRFSQLGRSEVPSKLTHTQQTILLPGLHPLFTIGRYLFRSTRMPKRQQTNTDKTVYRGLWNNPHPREIGQYLSAATFHFASLTAVLPQQAQCPGNFSRVFSYLRVCLETRRLVS